MLDLLILLITEYANDDCNKPIGEIEQVIMNIIIVLSEK